LPGDSSCCIAILVTFDWSYLVFIGAAVQLGGIASYVSGTLRGTTRPNRVTWLMWSVAPLIATFAAVSDGVRLSALPVFMSGFGPLLVFLASFANPRSFWKLERFDYLCGLFSLLALILWAVTREPDVAIVFSILSDFSAAVPTLRKAWRAPESEDSAAYSTGLFNSLTAFPAIGTWAFTSVAFPVYLVVINTSLFVSVAAPRGERVR